MDKMIAFCGINCDHCPAFLATQKDDDDERRKVAELWSKQYNANLKPEDIKCNGCISKVEPFFSHCNVCEIRKCGQERNLENCALCDDYACEKLNKLLEIVPEAKLTLEEVIKNKKSNS